MCLTSESDIGGQEENGEGGEGVRQDLNLNRRKSKKYEPIKLKERLVLKIDSLSNSNSISSDDKNAEASQFDR